MHQTSFGKVVLTLGRFLRKDVAFESVFPFDFTGTGEVNRFFALDLVFTFGILLYLVG